MWTFLKNIRKLVMGGLLCLIFGAGISFPGLSQPLANNLNSAAENAHPTLKENKVEMARQYSLTKFYPISSYPGKIVTIFGTGFLFGTQVYFGGSRLIPSPNVEFVDSNTLKVTVPASSTGSGNINGYLTVVIPGASQEFTTQNFPLPAAYPNAGDLTTISPEFVLWGDVSGDGLPAQANDITLARSFIQSQATPTLRQFVASDVYPCNCPLNIEGCSQSSCVTQPGRSRGNGILSEGNGTTVDGDLSLLGKVAITQATF
ncbi:MAG TPA: IPT/TIG domain-containing protein [Acidobacteriota bacterium]|nr:IPT/TIG domain-containing protein [Acidobacteriota bacterium]